MSEELDTHTVGHAGKLETAKPVIASNNVDSMYRYHREPSGCIPIESPRGAAATQNEAGTEVGSVHATSLRDLRDAREFLTEKAELFDLRDVDSQLEDLIDPTLDRVIEELNQKDATVCGLVVCTITSMLQNHPALVKYVSGPKNAYPRSVEEIHADMAAEIPRSVMMLQYELHAALDARDCEGEPGDSSTDCEPDSYDVEDGDGGERLSGQISNSGSYSTPSHLPVYPRYDDSEADGEEELLRRPYCLSPADLLNALDCDLQLESTFSLEHSDRELDGALRTALLFFLKELNSPNVTVCGLMVGTLARFMRSHPALSGHTDFRSMATS